MESVEPYRSAPVGRYFRIGNTLFDLSDITHVVCLNGREKGTTIYHIYTKNHGKLAADFNEKSGDELVAALEEYRRGQT